MEETSLDVDKRVMDVNYFGAVGLAKGVLQACAPPLRAPAGAGGKTGPSGGVDGGSGWTGAEVRFVVVNSVQGKFGMAFRSSYAASKHALVGFFDCLRAERGLQGIGVLNVFPGYVRTRYVYPRNRVLLFAVFPYSCSCVGGPFDRIERGGKSRFLSRPKSNSKSLGPWPGCRALASSR